MWWWVIFSDLKFALQSHRRQLTSYSTIWIIIVKFLDRYKLNSLEQIMHFEQQAWPNPITVSASLMSVLCVHNWTTHGCWGWYVQLSAIWVINTSAFSARIFGVWSDQTIKQIHETVDITSFYRNSSSKLPCFPFESYESTFLSSKKKSIVITSHNSD